MGTIIRMTPISGVHSEDPLCYLLEVDDCRILLDCGWDERFETDFLQTLASVASSIDFVLLSHPDLLHLGALPYAVGHLGLDCPIFATRPVWQMGHLCMYDVLMSRRANEDFDVFDADDNDNAFNDQRFHLLKYSQHADLTGRGVGIRVTPFQAGHMLGGTIWKIQKDQEEIVYAVDCNKQKERLLNGTVLESVSERPAVLITDAFNAQYTQAQKRGARDAELLNSALATLRAGGSVLMPTDTAGRVFELMMVLEARWKKDKLRDQYPLVLLHHQAKNVVEYGKILTEWMRDNCKFGFESFHLLPQLSGLDELTASGAPCLVLASFSSLETGYARDVFFRWAHDPRNLVLFTDRAHPDTLGRLLVDFSLHRQPPPRSMPLVVHRRVALEGEELEAFQDKHRAIREARLQALREAREDRERQEAERAAEMELDSDEEDDAKTEQLVKSSRMFPAVEKQATFDDYGETIDHHDYMDSEQLELEAAAKDKVDQQELEKDPSLQQETYPTKCVVETLEVHINCKVKYVDFEGRYDGNDLMILLRYMRPHKLLIVHADHASSEYLRGVCEKTICRVGDVFAPQARPQQTIDVTSDRLIRKAKVEDNLYDKIEFFYSEIERYHLARIDAVVRQAAESAEDGEQPAAEQEFWLDVPKTQLDSNGKTGAQGTVRPVTMVGDLKLSQLAILLAEAGIEARFESGVLVCCGGKVMLQKSAPHNKIEMHGALCGDYYKVRDILYSQFDMF